MDKLLTVEQVAEYLQLSTRTIYSYIQTGKLKATKLGKSWRVSEEELQNFLKAQLQ